jgi:trehalose utilization protein
MLRITIFNEFVHEKTEDRVKAIYPEGIHMALATVLAEDDLEIRTVTLDDPECGLTQEVLNNTDVLFWWAHMRHGSVPDEVARRVADAVQCGMGAIFLHSAHMSKPFQYLMGTPCTLTWREDGDRELVWVCNPTHPIAKGIDRFIHLEHEEIYGEPFFIPEPDELVFIGNFEGGEVFRSGCCYQRGLGKVFYFQPGHETFPTYYHPNVIRVLKNALRWAAPVTRVDRVICPHVKKPLESN